MDSRKVAGDESLDILRIARAVYPESMGGAAIHVHSMSERQVDMGHDVTILTTDRGNRELPRREERDGYQIIRDRELTTLFGNSITPWFVSSFKRYQDKYDIVHVHSHLSLISNISALLSRFDNTPFVLTNHGLRSQTAPEWVQDIYLPTVGKFTFNSADTVFTYSESECEQLRELGVSSSISVIHNGVDCTQFTPDERSTDKNQLLFVGRLRSTKGPHIALQVLHRLQSDFPDLTMKMVGDGPMRNEITSIVANYRLEDSVDLIAEVPNKEMPRLFNESLIFILPTSREGVPRTLLEAMACGIPVVATNLSQVEPVVDGGGLLVERNIDEFLEAIRTLLTSPEQRQNMSTQGRNRVLENYSWKETVAETTKKYYDIL